jgi:quercetin dioxygenase-like cupin family protein
MIVHITLDPGATVPAHSHPHEQVGYVLSGELSLTIGGVEHSLKPGDSYLIPSNVEHAGVTDGGVEVIDVFSPPREEYR